MSIRSDLNASAAAYLSSGSDANGGSIALGGAAGTVTLSMTAAQTDNLADEFSTVLVEVLAENKGIKKRGPVVTYLYDLELVDGSGNVTRALQGEVHVRRNVTT